ncbi:hypothetical protein CATMIT_01988, partial [Catenibacterium mitsuokai DSM 15897]
MYGGGFATIPAYLADLFGTPDGRRHPRPPAHRLGHRRHPRPGGGQLHARLPARPGPAAFAGLQHHDVYPGRDAGAGPAVQPAGAADRA